MIVKDFNKKLKLFISIASPTWMSVAVCFLISLGTVLLYYSYKTVVSVDHGEDQYILNFIKVDFNSALAKLSSYSFVNNLVPILFWAIVGISVYIFVRLMVGDVDELWLDLTKRKRYLWPNGSNAKPHIIVDFFERVVLRIIIFVCLVIYFVNFVSPFFSGGVVVPDVFGPHNTMLINNDKIVSIPLFIILEMLALYGVVVLLRLLVMRRRLLSRVG